jgi:hypothetical protein
MNLRCSARQRSLSAASQRIHSKRKPAALRICARRTTSHNAAAASMRRVASSMLHVPSVRRQRSSYVCMQSRAAEGVAVDHLSWAQPPSSPAQLQRERAPRRTRQRSQERRSALLSWASPGNSPGRVKAAVRVLAAQQARVWRAKQQLRSVIYCVSGTQRVPPCAGLACRGLCCPRGPTRASNKALQKLKRSIKRRRAQPRRRGGQAASVAGASARTRVRAASSLLGRVAPRTHRQSLAQAQRGAGARPAHSEGRKGSGRGTHMVLFA